MKMLLKLIGTILKLGIYACIFLTPVLGVWLASSLAAFSNRSTLLSVIAGVFLFPVLPLLWELWSSYKRRKLGKSGEQTLTWGDRLIIRTLVINLVAIVALLAWQPSNSFVALSTRGDWMLEGMKGDAVEVTRQSLFKIAGGLEGLYNAFNKNPYERYDDGSDKIKPEPQTDRVARNPFQELPKPVNSNPSNDKPQPTTDKVKPPTDKPQPVASKPQPNNNNSQPIANKTQPVKDNSQQIATKPIKNEWAWDGQGLHPAIANMPASVETSIESVAKYIVSKETDPVLRVKALHDYVADRIAYDAESYFAGVFPPQDAETVFRTHKSVCAGYAQLLEALGKSAGVEIVYVTGKSRSQISELSGRGHAWNGVKVNGQWYLIDPTWDSGYISREKGFTKSYRTEYLMPPPEVIGITHFPKDPAWQLRSTPINQGEFLRQPMMTPKFFADGLSLISPQRSQVDTNSDAVINLANPQKRWILASYRPKGSGGSQNCGQPIQDSQISCPVPNAGSYEVSLFTSTEDGGNFNYVGRLEFNKT
jgi:transglutaminase-like putative cysteine protease